MGGLARQSNIPEDILVAFTISGLPKHLADTIVLNSKNGLNWLELYSICERLEPSRGMNEYHEEAIGEDSINRIRKPIERWKRPPRCFLCGRVGIWLVGVIRIQTIKGEAHGGGEGYLFR
ncbi:hypothetical protein NGRA_2277 [Nosema granulosis]|uniref:Uncharacterized protein n=1 Tax=Nosema granulosis TaxID=83296 RepID=A0A9P6KXV7_9MICR|nr:hypothetical protein NGRA_2277 [Nosema granulosis]